MVVSTSSPQNKGGMGLFMQGTIYGNILAIWYKGLKQKFKFWLKCTYFSLTDLQKEPPEGVLSYKVLSRWFLGECRVCKKNMGNF